MIMLFKSYQKTGKTNLLLFISLTVSGLLANHFKLPLFFGVDFIFGSIFSMLALRIFGLRWGLIAAVIISSYTIRIWLQAYSMWILVAEVLIVGLIRKQWKLTYIVSDILYWFIAGLPLVFFFYSGFMSISSGNALFLWLKLTVNGILNVGLMQTAYIFAMLLLRKSKISLSEITFDILTLIILIPALSQVSFHVRDEVRTLQKNTHDQLVAISRNIANTLNTWFALHLKQLEWLADAAETDSVAAMQAKMDQAVRMGGDFIRMGYMDSRATSVAYTPLLDELGNSNIGRNFADRSYFPELKKRLSPMLTNVMMGKIGRPQPIVAMITPIIKQKLFDGYIGGVIDLQGLETVISNNTKDSSLPGLSYLLTDQTGKVIISSRAEQIDTLY
ncbi:MAG: hypothetical protein D3910_12975 [Candidatus Electrothrix sp. ATG2]|nr:hypothetical protein [Candidatus Electrothrix sp. ATG2]